MTTLMNGSNSTTDTSIDIDMNSALAAAVVAAAELAKNGGAASLYFNSNKQADDFPMMISPSQQQQHQEDDASASSDSDDNEDQEQNAEQRICKSRARNREHARRTRIRKKAQLGKLQAQVKGLEDERRDLQQSLEEYSIASILTGLSRGSDRKSQKVNTVQTLLQQANSTCTDDTTTTTTTNEKGGKQRRNRFVSVDMTDETTAPPPPPPLSIKIGGKTAFLGGAYPNRINWKTGVYHSHDGAGVPKQLSTKQLATLRYVFLFPRAR
jgi:hypothetical protein